MRFLEIRNVLVSLLLAATTLASSQALAHKLSVFAYAEGNQVYVEGYFADGKKAQNSKVEVFNSAGELLYEGITGDEGDYRFTIDKPVNLKIVLNAGMGHRGEFLLPAADMGDGSDAVGDFEQSAEAVTPQEMSATEAEASLGGDSAAADVSTTQLERVVHKAVNEAIRPLVRELDESRQKAKLTDLLGAVGIIFGFMGLFFFFKARQKEADKQ